MSERVRFAASPTPIHGLNVALPLRLTLIGAMEARNRTNGSVLPLGRKTRALLAILALSAPRAMPRAKLAEMLWSRRLEEQARASLRQEIHRLLDALHPVDAEIIRVTRDHLSLRREVTWVDVQQVYATTPENADALALLDGELLHGFDGLDPVFDAWLAAEREKLRDHARGVAQTLLRESVAPEDVLPTAQLLVKIDRAHEGAWRTIMRVHAERGERALAVQAYERCRVALAELMDARPAPETQRLITDIRAGTLLPDAAPGPAEPAPRPGPASRTPYVVRLAVSPLRLIGCGPEEEGLAVGLAEEMTGALARFRWLSLVSPGLAEPDAAPLDFRLDGTIQRVDSRLRIGTRLVDLRADGQVIWGRHFDSGTDDMLRMQDELAADVVARIEPELRLAEARRAALLPSELASAHQLVLQAYSLIGRMQRPDVELAGSFLARALQIQPDFAAAYAARAYWHSFMLSQGWAADPELSRAEAGECAERAIVLDPQDARALTIAGHVRSFMFHRPREAVELHAQAVAVNPFLAGAWGYSAANQIYLGQLDEAERHLARYRRLTPDEAVFGAVNAATVRLELARHRYDLAVQYGRRNTELNPFHREGLTHYLSALGHAGLREEAALVRKRLLAIEPGFSVQLSYARNPYEPQGLSEHYAQGLRLAGLQETDTQAGSEAA